MPAFSTICGDLIPCESRDPSRDHTLHRVELHRVAVVLYIGGSLVPTPSAGVLGYSDEGPPRDVPWRRLVAGGGIRRPPLRLSRPVVASGCHTAETANALSKYQLVNFNALIGLLCVTPRTHLRAIKLLQTNLF